jgi:lysophospholipase L1-like esterase
MGRQLLGLVLSAVIGHAAAAWSAVPRQGSAAPPVRASLVFVGSSIFHRWTHLAADMAPLPVVNRAFDGAQTTDMLRILDSVLLGEMPKVVVYYCGSNDVSAGQPAAAIFGRIREFFARARMARPEMRLVFVSIIRAPEKQDRWQVVDEVNRRVEAFAVDTKQLQYVDVNHVLFDRDGTPKVELYLSDQLHLRPAAYDGLTRILKPVLTNAFGTR